MNKYFKIGLVIGFVMGIMTINVYSYIPVYRNIKEAFTLMFGGL